LNNKRSDINIENIWATTAVTHSVDTFTRTTVTLSLPEMIAAMRMVSALAEGSQELGVRRGGKAKKTTTRKGMGDTKSKSPSRKTLWMTRRGNRRDGSTNL
jgi:hypothetical protein